MELNKQISQHNYYLFLWHAVFLALAINFTDVDTIIPAMMLDAGGVLPVIFPFLGGWIITEFGFTKFFVLFMLIIFSSFYFICKIDCQK